MLAFILVQTKGGKEKNIFEYWSKLKEVKEAHILFGEWDFILKVEAKNENALATFVIEKVRNIPEVVNTNTMIVAQSL